MKSKVCFVAAIVLVIAALQISSVKADVPTVLSITRRTESGNLFLDVRVRHANPSSSHYIEYIKIDSDGSIREFSDLPKATTTESTFTVNLGPANPKVVKSQAICNIHGASAFLQEGGTGGGGIPGYPMMALVIGFIASLFWYALMRSRKSVYF